MSDVTRILSEIESGDQHASAELLPLVYDELRKLAAARMANERPDHTLSATALVHDAYIRLVDVKQAQHWNSRGHFFAAAAEAMRRILIEKARSKQRDKHGGQLQRIELAEGELVCSMKPPELLALDEALTALALEDPKKAKLVELRFFVGLTVEEAAQVLGISAITARRHWRYARAWLHQQMAVEGTALVAPETEDSDFFDLE
jgi:RNA polymerase sigma factor (TIGR02999 family)